MPAIPASGTPLVSVIIPARNEEANLGACLASLTAQIGVDYEIIVVNDHSTDRTAAIAKSFPAVQVIPAPDLPAGWTGKNNAVIAGAARAHSQWLLFTDADTVHLPGSLAASVAEAEREHADLLSYSPEQIVQTLAERAVMPAVFADLAATFRPSDVSDPSSPAAAANGQFILIRRDVYNAVGGHRAIASEILEDVALARAVKQSGRKIFFRYGGDRLRTRMYRNFQQLREGWTKNLALLFPSPQKLAALRLAEFALTVAGLALAIVGIISRHPLLIVLGILPAAATFIRLRRAHFSFSSTFVALFGLPVFAYLLLRSQRFNTRGRVTWKGREYSRAEVNPHSGAGV